MKFPKLIPVLMLLFSAAVAAETVYVTDQLQLGLHLAPDTSDKPFRTLVSGTELEVLEQTRFYWRVRTPEGEEGWVKANYLISNKPAAGRLIDLETENAALTARLEQVLEQTSDVRTRIDGLQAELDQSRQAGEQALAEAETLREQNLALENRMTRFRGSVPSTWAMLAAGLMLVLGLFAGFMFFDYRSRKRFGGFRVY